MKPQQILPITMIVLSVAAACVFFYYGDYRRTVYWLSSASLIAAVTF